MRLKVLRRCTAACIGLALAAFTGNASAAVMKLESWLINLDGVVAESDNGDPIPVAVDASGFDLSTGLGTLTMTLGGAGNHYAGLFLDHDIDDVAAPDPNTYFNEDGAPSGTPASGQTWEIDEPGYGAGIDGSGGTEYFGDIYGNTGSAALDNLLFFDDFDGQSLLLPHGGVDVSMAMAFSFSLDPGEIAVIDFVLDTQQPTGFHLRHFDPDSLAAGDPDANIYFSGTLSVIPASTVPAPGTALLLAAAGLLALRRRRRH